MKRQHSKIELPAFRRPNLEWITDQLHILGQSKDTGVSRNIVQENDLARFAQRFGLFMEVIGRVPYMSCFICGREFIEHSVDTIPFCSKEYHDFYYESFRSNNQPELVEMDEEQKRKRDAIVRGIILGGDEDGRS